MKQYLTLTFYILIFALLTACGSNPNTSPDAGSLSFNIKLSRPATAYQTAYLTGNDICIDYGVATVTAVVKDSSGKTVTSGSWSCSAHQGIISGIPSGNNYTVTLEGQDSNNTVTWSGEKTGISINKGETTAAGTIAMTYIGSDITAPTVLSTTPSDSAPTVPVTSLLTATFSEKMALSSVNTTTFKLTNGTTPVSGSVTYDSNTKKAIFIPATNLSYSTTYTATITTGVEDMAGNNMQANKAWSFTAEAQPTSAPSAPTGIVATAGNGQATITWDAVTGATSYNIYWSTTSGVTINPLTKITGVTSPYIHTGRNNGSTYYYVVTAENGIGESNTSAEVSAIPVATDTTPPTGSVIINNNATYTNSTTVTLTLSATDSNGVSQMCISNETTCSTSSWETYTTSKSWTLTTGDGIKTVYAWFKDGAGNVSVVAADTITLTTIVSTNSIKLPKTGQTTCYNSSGTVIACAGTGQDGELHRGVAWPNPRFTDNGDSTVSDNLTGLVWTKDGNTPGPVACSPAVSKTWQAALDYVACLNFNSYLGYTGWRLPNVNEIGSLVHAGQLYPFEWLSLQGFDNVQWHYYWSSTSGAGGPGSAWIVNMGSGGMAYYSKSNSSVFAWPVRSGQSGLFGFSIIQLPRTGQTTCYDSAGTVIPCAGTGQDGDIQAGVPWPDPRFIDNGDATITDNLTGLMWTRNGSTPGPATCSPATDKTWQDGLAYIACLNINSYLGYNDWRLPNVNELRSMGHGGQSDTATWLNTQGFNNVQSLSYWSSTSNAGQPNVAWIVYMWDGGLYNGSKSNGSYYVWPVRSGQ